MARNVISFRMALAAAVLASALYADPFACDLSAYKSQPGLTATVADNHLAVVWEGDKGRQLMLTFASQNRAPVIQELAVRRKGGAWEKLAAWKDVSPAIKTMMKGDYFVTSGEVLIDSSSVLPGKVVADVPFGKHHFEIPFPAGQKWVRFAAWDSAGNGATAQPVKLASAAQ